LRKLPVVAQSSATLVDRRSTHKPTTGRAAFNECGAVSPI
jgi:hypothetical protein